jgi:hypothetical protein
MAEALGIVKNKQNDNAKRECGKRSRGRLVVWMCV